MSRARVFSLVVSVTLALVIFSACGNEPAGKVSLAEPADGARVVSPFSVQMRAEGVTVEPASAGVHDRRGHHHIVVDENLPPKGQPIPSDAQHLHFGKGQTEATLDLPPGEHTLQLAFADANHVPYSPYVTATIKVTVTGQRKVSFLEPASAAQVTSPFTVKMGAAGVVVEPASAGVHEGAGHHHIIVDADLPASGQPIPSDTQHLHFGKGQTEATLDLPPGEHTLHLAFAKGDHVPYSPYVAATLKVTVVK